MRGKFLKILSLPLMTFILSVTAFAQLPDASSLSGKPNDDELPKGFHESLAKKRIEAEKKEYDELLGKGEELVNISEELDKSFETNRQITGEDTKKIEKLEKAVKKIRNDLGAKDDSSQSEKEEDLTPKASTTQGIIKSIKKVSSDLFSDLKKNTRYSISVFSLQSSNNLLKLIKLLKFTEK